MKISELYVYPIKSLRGTTLTEASLTRTGFKHDRRFMLLKVIPEDDGTETLKNMHVPHFPEMSLFFTDMDTEAGVVNVTYRPPGELDGDVKRLEIPLQPAVRGLKELAIVMHQSPTKGYDMGSAYNDWFSGCFGYRVVLAYLGPNSRRVLGTFAPSRSLVHRDRQYTGTSTRIFVALCAMVLVLALAGTSGVSNDAVPVAVGVILVVLVSSIALQAWPSFIWEWVNGEEKLTFADTAPYLITSTTSLDNVSERLAGDLQMDMTKFRPNIVISGAKTAFEEDFWTELTIGSDTTLLLTHNCVRCQSINVDFSTGKIGTGEIGSVFKKLMKDRRVDKGAKFSPVFGRYAFLGGGEKEKARVKIGDEVVVARRVGGRSVYDWPGLTN